MPLMPGLPERKVFIMVRWLLTASCPTISNFFAGDNCPTKDDVCHRISSNHHDPGLEEGCHGFLSEIQFFSQASPQASPQLLQSTPKTFDLFQWSVSSHNDIYELVIKPDLLFLTWFDYLRNVI